MKAIIARDFAPLDQLVYADWPEPQASGRTVVIEAEAIGVNYPDGLLVQGSTRCGRRRLSCRAWRSPAGSSRSGPT